MLAARVAALSVVSSLLEGSKPFLAIAKEKFVDLSIAFFVNLFFVFWGVSPQ
jgi:hypothetical protein